MRKIFLSALIIILSISSVYAAVDYEKLYTQTEPFETALYNDIDPFEDEESLIYAYNPYPLFRTSAYLYFKDKTISPGYYSLTPRKLKGRYVLLFKQGGKVRFIIPAAKKENTPFNFYKANLPERKKNLWQKFTAAVSNRFYKTFKSSQKTPPPKSYIQTETDVRYIAVILYYGENKYTAVFKRTPY